VYHKSYIIKRSINPTKTKDFNAQKLTSNVAQQRMYTETTTINESRGQGCQIFLDKKLQIGDNITNGHDICQIAIK
jgi:hypothetical protein